MSLTHEQFVWWSEFIHLVKHHQIDWVDASSTEFDDAHKIYNRYHNVVPAALVRTMNPKHIATILQFTRQNEIPLAIRGGGHHIAGYGSCDAGIVIDFSHYRGVRLDNASGTAEVDPGARLCDVDIELTRHGRVIPTGTVSDTGIAGLTLGGGIGWLVGRHGLTCDNLIGADVILADGTTVAAESPEHVDLLWALRGGGGNFGIVTAFRYRTHPLPSITTGSLSVPLTRAAETLTLVAQYLDERCPRDLTVAPAFMRTTTNEPVLSVDFCMAGEDASILDDFRTEIGDGDWCLQQETNYVRWQSTFDQSFQPPMRGYWKASYGSSIHRTSIEHLVEAFATAPVRRAAIIVEHLHGAFRDTTADQSAFPLRDSKFGILIAARWEDSDDDAKAIGWVRDTFKAIDPDEDTPTYSNYADVDDSRAVKSYAHDIAGRLARVKQKYDPTNVFHRNHNVKPSEHLETAT